MMHAHGNNADAIIIDMHMHTVIHITLKRRRATVTISRFEPSEPPTRRYVSRVRRPIFVVSNGVHALHEIVGRSMSISMGDATVLPPGRISD